MEPASPYLFFFFKNLKNALKNLTVNIVQLLQQTEHNRAPDFFLCYF